MASKPPTPQSTRPPCVCSGFCLQYQGCTCEQAEFNKRMAEQTRLDTRRLEWLLNRINVFGWVGASKALPWMLDGPEIDRAMLDEAMKQEEQEKHAWIRD